MTNGDELDRFIEREAKSYNSPPETPREAMWSEIRASLGEGAVEAGAGGGDLDLTRRRWLRGGRARPWLDWRWGMGLAVAATLVVGFALGRISTERGLLPLPGPSGSSAPSAVAGGADPSAPVRLAAATHMGQAEALLTLFRTSDRVEDRAATAEWARDLLITTRLMLDSRAADDPLLVQLLGDLELVLVQIVHVGTGPEEMELIERGIEERQLITKLRAAAGDPLETSI